MIFILLFQEYEKVTIVHIDFFPNELRIKFSFLRDNTFTRKELKIIETHNVSVSKKEFEFIYKNVHSGDILTLKSDFIKEAIHKE